MCAVPGRVIFAAQLCYWLHGSFLNSGPLAQVPAHQQPAQSLSSLLFLLLLLLFYFVFVSYGTGGGIWDQRKVRSYKCPSHTIHRRNIKSTGTLRYVLRILQTTINDSLSRATLLTQIRSQQLSAQYKRLIDGFKQS